MNTENTDLEALLLFDEQLPDEVKDASQCFQSQCPPDRKFKTENLFKFRRGRGDFHASVVAALIAFVFLFFFFTETGWHKRKLPDNLGSYIGYQFGISEIEGRAKRLGSILKQSWIAPLLCLLILIPASFLNLRKSWRVRRWRSRFLLPTDASYETSKYIAALEFVAYFILYTLTVPLSGYLLATVFFGVFLTWRLGYRSKKWLFISLLASVTIVVVFRTLLQIKTPGSIWLYDQLPSAMRAFMLTYF